MDLSVVHVKWHLPTQATLPWGGYNAGKEENLCAHCTQLYLDIDIDIDMYVCIYMKREREKERESKQLTCHDRRH